VSPRLEEDQWHLAKRARRLRTICLDIDSLPVRTTLRSAVGLVQRSTLAMFCTGPRPRRSTGRPSWWLKRSSGQAAVAPIAAVEAMSVSMGVTIREFATDGSKEFTPGRNPRGTQVHTSECKSASDKLRGFRGGRHACESVTARQMDFQLPRFCSPLAPLCTAPKGSRSSCIAPARRTSVDCVNNHIS